MKPAGVSTFSSSASAPPSAGVTLGQRLSAATPAERARLAARLGRELSLRHGRAIESGDRRLLLEHPSCDHILVDGDRFVTFDLEIAYVRGRAPETLAVREVAGFLYSAAKACGNASHASDGVVEAFCEAYGSPERLQRVARYLAGGHVPLLRRLAGRTSARRRTTRLALASRVKTWAQSGR